jgi:hypothetical protein
MLAALSAISSMWPDDPATATALRLGEQSKDAAVRAKINRRAATSEERS